MDAPSARQRTEAELEGAWTLGPDELARLIGREPTPLREVLEVAIS